MAAPHVAGVVALVQAVEAQESVDTCVNPDTEAKISVVERVLRSARPVDHMAPYVATGGIVNAADAVNCSLNLPWPLPTPPPLPAPPSMPPNDLQAVDSGQGSYLLSWTSVADASYYLIEREQRRKNGRRVSGTYFYVDAVPGPDPEALSHEDVTETAENVYYRIAAGNVAGNTVMSEWVLAQSGGMRQFYLTPFAEPGADAPTACAAGYHFASLWELTDPSNLKYNTSLGLTLADSGQGPPQWTGWVRTGYVANTSGAAGRANCDGWTSSDALDYGTFATLPADWSESPGWLGWLDSD